MIGLLALTVMVGQVEERPFLGHDAVRAAHADLARQPAAIRPYLRYIARPARWSEDRWEYYIPVLAGHVNQLSTSSVIAKPVPIGAGLLRINVTDYGPHFVKAWERLHDPYMELPCVIDDSYFWPGGVWPGDGKHYPARSFKVTRTINRGAFWMLVREKDERLWGVTLKADQKLLDELAHWTHSRVPIVRADWFHNQTAAQVDRKPGFYDFFPFRDRQGYEKLGGFNRRLFEDFRLPLREAIARSGVTLQSRAIAMFDSAGGLYAFSIDFKKAIEERNPLKVFGAAIELVADAFETYILLPNGFWLTALFNAKGELQDFAPPDIAGDHRSRSNDKRVHVNVSCIRCHPGGGLQDLDAWARNLAKPPLKLNVFDRDLYRGEEEAAKLRQQYLRKLEPAMQRARAIYEEAVLEATGLTSTEYAKRYAELWEEYEDAAVSTAYVAADVGLAEEELRDKLLAYLKATGNLDPVVAGWVLVGERQRPIGIRQYEEALPALYAAIRP